MLDLLASQRGHFLLESGYHGSLWLDLEALFLEPARIEPLARELAVRLAKHGAEVVCGPLVEGAFLALMVARELGVPFTYSERFESGGDLYPYGYRVPPTLHRHLRGKRVVIVNDVISAGSAVRGTWSDLESLGATTIAVAALLVLGDWTARFTSENRIALEALRSEPYELWLPAECALCARGEPLERKIQSI
jgi:orotate phosphoribosyltransferase